MQTLGAHAPRRRRIERAAEVRRQRRIGRQRVERHDGANPRIVHQRVPEDGPHLFHLREECCSVFSGRGEGLGERRAADRPLDAATLAQRSVGGLDADTLE